MKTSVLGVALAIALAVSTAALVQRPPIPPNATVAFVSAQRLTNETTIGKQGVARIQALQQQKQADLRSRQQALETIGQQLTSAADAATRASLGKQEQEQRTALERATSESQTEIQTLQRQMSAELQSRLRVEIPEVIKGSAIQIVVQQETAVVWAAPALDLTSAVIERMNVALGTAPAGAPAQ